MPFTTAQLSTIKAAIAAETDPVFVGYRQAGALGAMAEWYSASTSPAFTVWKTAVPLAAVGTAMDSGEVAGLTTSNTSRLQVMAAYSGGSFNPSLPDVQSGFNSVFSGAGGALTRAALLALWKRPAKRIEKLFAVGTGTDAAPATMGYEGNVNINDILAAQAA